MTAKERRQLEALRRELIRDIRRNAGAGTVRAMLRECYRETLAQLEQELNR